MKFIKPILTILSLLLLIAANAQTPVTPSPKGGWIKANSNYGSIQDRISAGKVFLFPTSCGTPAELYGTDLGQAALFFDSCGHTLYKYDPNLHEWSEIRGGGGSTLPYNGDTSFFLAGDSTLHEFVELKVHDTCCGTSHISNDTLFVVGGNSGTVVQDGLVTPGYVTWSGTGLTYDVTSATYIIGGITYVSDAGQVTLDVADPDNPRIDVIAVDTSGNIVAIAGDPAPNPAEPQVDPGSQVLLTSISVPAGAVVPVVTQTVVYDENTENFTGTASGITLNVDNTTNPYHLTKSADVGSWTTQKVIVFTKNTGTTDASNYSMMKLFIRLKAAISTNNIRISFLNGSTVVSNALTLSAAVGYTRTLAGSYQNISIPFTSFHFTSNIFDRIRFTMSGAGGGFYVDYIQLQGGIYPPATDNPYPINFSHNYTGDTLIITLSDGRQLKTKDSTGALQDLESVTDAGAVTLNDIITGNVTAYNNAETKSISLDADNPSITMNGVGTTLHINANNITSVKDLEFPNVSGKLAESVTVNGTTTHAATDGNINLGTIDGTDTTSLSNRINLKVNISDTAAMLSPYLRSNVAAATYRTQAQVRADISLTTTGSSGAATYNNTTGVLNVPQYSGGTTTNALTFNNSGSGDASGTTFNGSAARTLSYNSIGAAPSFTFTTNNQTGAATYSSNIINVPRYDLQLARPAGQVIRGAGTTSYSDTNFVFDTTKGYLGVNTKTPTGALEVWQPKAAFAGTVSKTSGSPTVTGIGTEFLSTIRPRDNITIGAESLVVLSVASNTSLTTETNFATSASGQTYTVPNLNSVPLFQVLPNSTISFSGARYITNNAPFSSMGIGYSALPNPYAPGNVAVGRNALAANTSGPSNTAVGYFALAANTTASGNTAVGNGALTSATTGIHNTAVGLSALGTNNATANTAIGYQAISNSATADHSTAVGDGALQSGGINCIAIGADAGRNNLGNNNIYIGYQAGFNAVSPTGSGNLVIGTGAKLLYNASNSANIFSTIFITNKNGADSAASTTSKVGINKIAPSYTFDVNGTVGTNKPISLSGTAPSVTAGTGAGTSPTVSVTGNDAAGYVTITTGTSPTASGNIVTITFSSAITNTPTSIQLTPAGENAATEIAKFYVDQSTASTTAWIIKNTSSALTASTTYKFYYSVTQ